MNVRPRFRRATRLLAAVAVLAVAGSACAGSDDELVIYSGRTRNLVGPLLEQFAQESGIDIAVKYGDSAELALLLAQEGSGTSADVFLAQNPGAVAFVGDQDLLAELPSSVLDKVDPAFRSDAGRWVGVSGRQRVLVYNEELVDAGDLPQSIDDVLDERFAGRVAVAPPNGSFQDFVSAMVIERGRDAAREWLTTLAAQDAPTYPNNNAIVDAVSRGEVEMGLVNHYYNYRFLDEDPSLPSRNASFDGRDLGNLVISASVSVLEGSDQSDAAVRFVEFLLAQEAQRYFSDETFEYPLASGVAPSADLPALDPSRWPDIDFDELGETLQTTTELIDEAGLR
jgi:iron(III) transport system substrate-binding protein